MRIFYRCGVLVFVWCLCGAMLPAWSQNILSEMDHDAHHVYNRMMILHGGDSAVHTSIQPYWRHDIVRLADSFSVLAVHPVDIHHVRTAWDQNNEFVIPSSSSGDRAPQVIPFDRYRMSRRPLWSTFYRTPAHFYEVDVKDFYLRVNPVIQVAAGRETYEEATTFVNQRGLNLRGGIGKNVYFQTLFLDNQVRYPNYVNQYTDTFGVVPGVGLFKGYHSALIDVENGRDYLLAYGYAGINFGKYIGMQIGHNQTFMGDGIRSLFLSDFSTPYFSLRFNTRIWKLHYQNIFAEIAADNFMSVNGISEPVPKKYMAAHYLSFKPSPHVTIGLFETVVFDRAGNRFELQYLNPIILYRTVEGLIGSPDNVILGMNARVDIRKSISWYGQFVLDDILISNILDGHLDWWGNKFGHQLGVKYINAFGIPFLDAQLEWNQVRPYTYSHYNSNSNYSNYKQPLAHPLGANFNEWIVALRYQASERLTFKSSLYVISTGEDVDSVSFGGNVILPNTQRPGDFGHAVGQGVETDILFWNTRVQYELSPGVFIDGQYLFRRKTSDIPERNGKTGLVQLGVRYNMTLREDVF